MNNEYCFNHRWCFEASREQILDVLFDVQSYPSWWVPVCIESRLIERGDENKVGLRAAMVTRGRMPYQMEWEFVVQRHDVGKSVTFELFGDAVGEATWSFCERETLCEVELDWTIRAEHLLLKRFSWLLRPAFQHNHCWSMQQGEKGLCAEVKRRARQRKELTGAYW